MRPLAIPLTVLLPACSWFGGPQASAPPAPAQPPLDGTAAAPPPDWQCPDEGPGPATCFVHVPGGTFLMGAQATDPSAPNHDPAALPHEGPPHSVTLSPYWILHDEAVASSYARCVDAGDCPPDAHRSGDGANIGSEERRSHAANLVSWQGARAYCAWIGGDLPTEAQWEYAARGSDARRFPWGNEPGCGTGITDPTQTWSREMQTPPCEQEGTVASANLRGPSAMGLHGMGGNVWEWVRDGYAPDAYAHHAPRDPVGPMEGELRVQRGGGWADPDAEDLRASNRVAMPADTMMVDVGFRCVWGAAR